MSLEISLAGRVSIGSDGVLIEEERLPGRQGRLVFAYLVSEHGRPVTRDELAEAIWGATPPARWEKALGVIASKLRVLLGECGLDGAKVLTSAFGCYRLELPQGSSVDVLAAARAADDAETALARGLTEQAKAAAREAVAVVRLPFLPGEDGAWVEQKRRELADVLDRALDCLADACLRSGEASEAAKWAQEAIALQPFRESGYRRLMHAHAAAGNRAEALQVYERCRQFLDQELGAYPSPETESIYRELLKTPTEEQPGAPSEPGPVSGAVATLVGESPHTPIQRQDALDPPENAAPIDRVRRRSRVLIAIGAVFLLSAAVAVAVIELTNQDSPGLNSVSAHSIAAIDTGSNRLVAAVPVGNGPTSVAIGDGSVWVTNAQDRSVSRIDPRTRVVVQRIDVGGDPSGIAVGAGAVWVANSLDGTVSRIDPHTNRVVQTIPVGVTPTAVAVDGGAVWVTSAAERSVTRIDAATGHAGKPIGTGALGRGIAVGGGSVWVTDESSSSVVRIDSRRGNVVAAVGVGNGPTGIAFGDDDVWVANSLDGTVSRIDSRTNRVTATIPVGAGPDGIAVGSGVVWVSGEFSQLIARIDPVENRVVERIPVANRPKGLALLENQIWFAVQPSGAGHRGGRLVVRGSGLIVGQIDPSFMTWSGTATALSSTYDGLVGQARRGGSDGTQIVPNLARSLPVITAGGTTYAFQLRSGLRYSNGTLVEASDFRRAFERPLRAGIQEVAEAPLVGSGACERQPRSCDLSRGIRTDDATGTIVFHLRRPEGTFLSELIRRPPIPRGTPDRNMGTRPVASTGPYMIESYVPGRALTLVRNPYFRLWSRAARPDGFPDEIQFRLAGLQGVTAVERGRADVAFLSSTQTEDVKALAESRARYPSQVHVHPERAIVFLFLNTTHPPFDDVRVRQAVSYAIDRGAIAASYGGPGFAEPTCQLRPPGTVAFQRYCPYTAAPGRTGEWKAPHLAAARRLVAASGTRGMKVTIWTYPGFWEQAAEEAVRALEKLGYRASIWRAESNDAYWAKTEDEKTRGVQAGMAGWFGLPRAPTFLLSGFKCKPRSLSFFCDGRVEAEIARALKLETTDQDAAQALWTKIERDVVDLAPEVPLFTPTHVNIVSKRVGNYQYNPEWGILFDQLWVR